MYWSHNYLAYPIGSFQLRWFIVVQNSYLVAFCPFSKKKRQLLGPVSSETITISRPENHLKVWQSKLHRNHYNLTRRVFFMSKSRQLLCIQFVVYLFHKIHTESNETVVIWWHHNSVRPFTGSALHYELISDLYVDINGSNSIRLSAGSAFYWLLTHMLISMAETC